MPSLAIPSQPPGSSLPGDRPPGAATRSMTPAAPPALRADRPPGTLTGTVTHPAPSALPTDRASGASTGTMTCAASRVLSGDRPAGTVTRPALSALPGDRPPGTPILSAPAAPPGDGPSWDDGRGWNDDGLEWAGSLTAREIAVLAALDRPDDPVDDWDEDPGDVPPVDPDAWLAGLPSPDEGLSDAPGDVPVEALPGLMPRSLGTGGGFDAGGMADRLLPGPVLAGLTADKWADGLSQASDDEIAGLMIAWRRVASWGAAGEFAAVAELVRRRGAQVAAGADPHLAEHVSDEVAMVLRLTSWAAGTLVDRAEGLARLPRTMAALRAGEIDVPKALVILGELSGLDGVHAARVEAAVIGRAGGWTTGELRRAVRHQVIAADPAAARRRKEKAEKQARVERWTEDAGTAALAGRDLPPAGVLAADAHLSTWATRLKAAGLAGNLDQLRAQVYLALLNGQPPQILLPTRPRDEEHAARAAAEGEPAGTYASSQGLPGSGHPGAREDSRKAATASAPTVGPPVRGSVNLLLPLSTWLGWSAVPGEATGFGPLDAADCRTLAAGLARDPATTWCITVTGPDGRALAHGCAKLGPGPPPSVPVGLGGGPGPPLSAAVGPGESLGSPPTAAAGSGEGPGPPPSPELRAWLASIPLAWLETGTCSHRRESSGYRPSRALTHLIQVRQVTCTAPGCRRPATSCDFEHTIPYHRGGRTCECNGGPCCRRHHRAKQAAGWRLAQPYPGTFLWTTPHGRSYRAEPDAYLI